MGRENVPTFPFCEVTLNSTSAAVLGLGEDLGDIFGDLRGVLFDDLVDFFFGGILSEFMEYY